MPRRRDRAQGSHQTPGASLSLLRAARLLLAGLYLPLSVTSTTRLPGEVLE